MERWMVINKKGDFDKLNNQIKLHPLIVRLLANRGITTKDEASLFLYGNIDSMYDATLMKDMKKGVSIIKDAIETKKE